MNAHLPQTFEPDPDLAWLSARSVAEDEFHEWVREGIRGLRECDHNPREDEDFSDWLIREAKSGRHLDALDWTERKAVDLANLAKGQRSFVRQMGGR